MFTNLISIPVIVNDLHSFLHLHTIHHSLQVLSFLQHHHIFLTLSFLSATYRHALFSLFFFKVKHYLGHLSFLSTNTSLLSPWVWNFQKLLPICVFLNSSPPFLKSALVGFFITICHLKLFWSRWPTISTLLYYNQSSQSSSCLTYQYHLTQWMTSSAFKHFLHLDFNLSPPFPNFSHLLSASLVIPSQSPHFLPCLLISFLLFQLINVAMTHSFNWKFFFLYILSELISSTLIFMVMISNVIAASQIILRTWDSYIQNLLHIY